MRPGGILGGGGLWRLLRTLEAAFAYRHTVCPRRDDDRQRMGGRRMSRRTWEGWRAVAWSASAREGLIAVAVIATASQGSEWNTAGGDRQITRKQSAEHTLSTATVGGLVKKWELTTGGDVSAAPAVDATTVYA